MAVDANVLINERIREELRAGKSARAAIEAGYDRALPSILDSNITTLLSGIILFQFGSGPIRGFAVTLCIGLVIHVFTAVFCTRVVWDYLLLRRRMQTVSI
jgi:preprotein translocase subunit SecD